MDKQFIKSFMNFVDEKDYWFPIKRFTKAELEELNELANTFKNLKEVFNLSTDTLIYFAQHYVEGYERLKEHDRDISSYGKRTE